MRHLARAATLLALVAAAAPAGAQMRHGGVPERVVADRPAGPYLVSLWAKPAVGTGMLYVVLDAPAGAPFVAPASVRVGVAPAAGTEPEAVYEAHAERVAHGARFVAHVAFPRDGAWRVRVVTAGPAGGGELRAGVQVPPPARPGPLDLSLYALPVALIAGFWTRGALARRRATPPPLPAVAR